jgi:hypothetical protein
MPYVTQECWSCGSSHEIEDGLVSGLPTMYCPQMEPGFLVIATEHLLPGPVPTEPLHLVDMEGIR